MTRYVVVCECGRVLAISDDPPGPVEIGALERHERGHREKALAVEVVDRAA